MMKFTPFYTRNAKGCTPVKLLLKQNQQQLLVSKYLVSGQIVIQLARQLIIIIIIEDVLCGMIIENQPIQLNRKVHEDNSQCKSIMTVCIVFYQLAVPCTVCVAEFPNQLEWHQIKSVEGIDTWLCV